MKLFPNFARHRLITHTNFTGIEKTLVKSSRRRVHFVKFEAFEVFFFLAPIRNFSLELFHTTYYIYCITLEKCEKECNMLEIILVQGFCPVKIEITQFLIGFHITPVIAFVHFLLGAGEGVLAAGELVVCQVFFFFAVS